MQGIGLLYCGTLIGNNGHLNVGSCRRMVKGSSWGKGTTCRMAKEEGKGKYQVYTLALIFLE